MKQFRDFLLLYSGAVRGVRKRCALAIVISGVGGCAEALGIVSLVPVLSDTDPSVAAMWPALLGIAAFLLAATALKLLAEHLVAGVTTTIERRLRMELTEQLVFAPWRQVSRLGQGQVTAAVMGESSMVANGVNALLQATATLLVIVVLTVVAAILTPTLLLIAAGFMAISVWIFWVRLRHVRANERAISQTTEDIGEEVSSVLSNLKYLRISGTDQAWLKLAEQNAQQLSELRYRQIMLPSVTRTLVDGVGALFLTLVVGLGLALLDSVSLGIVFVALFYRIAPRVQMVQNYLGAAVGVATWIERWNSRRDSLGETKAPSIKAATGERGSAPEIDFQSVSFSYPGRPALLEGVTFHINQGEHVAIVGPSGAGKSTILDLMLGLFPADTGRVLIDRKEPSPEDWRELRANVGVVPQEVPLRRGTIADNICWDRARDEELLNRAIGLAALSDLVASLEEGVETRIDSRSIGVSGGQRQRMGVARALYRNPRLLVLDEATSALDSATERQLLDTVAGLPAGITVVYVSHRIAVLDYVSRVLKVDDGEVLVTVR